METVRVISADSHVNEPEAAWERIPKDLREKGPHFVQDPPGKKGLFIVFDGYEPDPVGATFTAGKKRAPGSIRDAVENFTWDQWRGPWEPNARLGDMDLDGVEVEVLYPSMGRNLYGLRQHEGLLQQAGMRSYNDWLADYARVSPKRLIALALLSGTDIDWSIREMERSVRNGHKGAMLPSGLPDGLNYADPTFERLWTAAEDLDVPIHFHINIVQGADRTKARQQASSLQQIGRRIIRRSTLEALDLLSDLTFGLVLDKHPRLRVVLAEYDLSWILPFMTKMDSGVRRARSENPEAANMSLLPSEAVRRQVFITFQEDPAGIAGAQALDLLDNCLWASDYPHGGSTWPDSMDAIRAQTANLDAESTRKILWDNASKLYHLN